jgi:hypothetical protein
MDLLVGTKVRFMAFIQLAVMSFIAVRPSKNYIDLNFKPIRSGCRHTAIQ